VDYSPPNHTRENNSGEALYTRQCSVTPRHIDVEVPMIKVPLTEHTRNYIIDDTSQTRQQRLRKDRKSSCLLSRLFSSLLHSRNINKTRRSNFT